MRGKWTQNDVEVAVPWPLRTSMFSKSTFCDGMPTARPSKSEPLLQQSASSPTSKIESWTWTFMLLSTSIPSALGASSVSLLGLKTLRERVRRANE